MPKRVVSVSRSKEPWLDLVSYGRRGSERSLRLTPEQIQQVARTVRRKPEVIVKVSGGARDAPGAKAHFDYIDRHGKLDIETDEGHVLRGKGAGARLVDDWNLDLSRGQYRSKPSAGEKDRRPKVVHNIVLSMPVHTPPQALLAAAQKFAREKFALQYRYAMVLHTDQDHPHVHLVVKAEHEHEPGKRLYIRKPMLQQWREEFAACLREQGVAANATPAHLRGKPRTGKKDPIHRRLQAMAAYDALSQDEKARRPPPASSSFMQTKVAAIARDLLDGRFDASDGKAKLVRTRQAVESDWLATAAALRAQGEEKLASEVEAYIKELPRVRTEQEQIAAGLRAQIDAQRSRQPSPGGRPPQRGGE